MIRKIKMAIFKVMAIDSNEILALIEGFIFGVGTGMVIATIILRILEV